MTRFIVPPVLGILLVAGLNLFLAGCDKPGVEGDFDEYLTRLSRVLEQDLPEWQLLSEARLAVKYPGSKARQAPVTDTRLGLIDFLSLGQCDLLHLVSERNSSLGKFMSSTARYHYEWLLTHGLTQCLETANVFSEKDSELVGELTQIAQAKREELATHYWNATWGSNEFQQFFAFSDRPLSQQEVSGIVAPATQALADYFGALPVGPVNNKPMTADTSLFSASEQAESHLQALQYHYGGRLIESLAVAGKAIQSANQMLKSRVASRPLCIDGKPSRTSEILYNVFSKYYVLQLQPHLSRIDKESAALWRVVEQYRPDQHSASRGAVITFYQHYFGANNALQTMRSALQKHAQIYTRLFASCGIKIGA